MERPSELNNADHIIEREVLDESDGKPVLIFLGYKVGIEDHPRNFLHRGRRCVQLSAHGQRELERNNRPPRDDTVFTCSP